MSNYIQLHFEGLSAQEQEILIAQLANIGYEGFEQGNDYLKAFISESDFDESSLKDLPKANHHPVKIETIVQKNWNQEWEKSFEPVMIENFCAIRAGFHSPVTGVEHEIIITPKMSFGTGHHATTYLVIQFMQQINFRGKDVLDLGTGTGVLAILAEKLHAENILAIDNDDWSIENASENIIANNCTRIQLVKGDGLVSDKSFDIILANINRHIILQNLPLLTKHLRINGVLILSGLLQDDYQQIADDALKEHLVVQKHSRKNDWIAMYLTNVNS